MVLLSMLTLNIFHPGYLLGREPVAKDLVLEKRPSQEVGFMLP